MLRTLTLENFKRHENLTVDFTAGLNVIMGGNYTGKSSVLHGILFAFFGATAVPCKADRIPRAGSNTFKVMLTFTLGDDEYTIIRTKTKDEIHLNGAMQANGKSAVAAKVESLLGMSQQQFQRLLYSEQKRTESLVALGSAELNKTIEEVAGASTIKDAITRLAAIVKTANDSLQAVKAAAGEAPSAEEGESLSLSLSQAKTALESATFEYDALNTSHQNVQATVTALKIEERTFSERFNALTRANASLASAKSAYDVVDFDEAAGDARIAELEAHHATVSEQYTDTKQAYSRVQAALKAYDEHRSRLSKLEAEKMVAESKLNPLLACKIEDVDDGLLADADKGYADAYSAMTTAAAKVKALQDAEKNGVCHSCNRPFEGHDPEELRKELEQAVVAKAVTETLKAKASDVLADLRNTRKAAEAARNAIASAQQAVTMRTEAWQNEVDNAVLGPADSLEDIKQKGVQLKNDMDEAAERLNKLRQTKAEASNALMRKQAAEDAVTQAQEALNACSFNLAELTDAEAKLVGLQSALLEAQTTKQAESTKVTTLTTMCANWAAAKAAYDKAVASIAQHEKRAETAKKLRAFLQDNFDSFMGDTWEGLLAMASHFTRQGTEGFIEQILRSDDGKFEYIEEGERYTVMGSASGAQRSLMGLSMQIAMSEMLPCPLPLLLLDEASADMDAEVSAALVTVLRNLGKQVIAVSHRELDATVADNVIAIEA